MFAGGKTLSPSSLSNPFLKDIHTAPLPPPLHHRASLTRFDIFFFSLVEAFELGLVSGLGIKGRKNVFGSKTTGEYSDV